jgi:GNAT superfamily N-acetyltransferase
VSTGLAHKIARTIVHVRALLSAVTDSGRISFERVGRADLAEVGAFRLRHYGRYASAYLLDQLDPDGLDEHDARSFVYAARSRGRMIATVRAVPAPFELEHFVPRARLGAAVGGELDRHVEVSRMLADPDFVRAGIGSAMLGFGGIDLLLHTKYRGYLAYIRLADGRSQTKIPGASTVLRFQIPARGPHEYAVVAGTIGIDMLWRGVGRVRNVSGRRAAVPQERA